MKNVADVTSLTLAHDEFLAVAERDEPALARDHTHFPDLIYVDQSIPMDTAE